MSKRSFRWRLM